MSATIGCCDFCQFYDFNGDDFGVYHGNGRCEHPDHPRNSDPGDLCDDFTLEAPFYAPEGESA